MGDNFHGNVTNSQIRTSKSTQNNEQNTITLVELQEEIKRVRILTPIISGLIAIILGVVSSAIFEFYIKNLFIK